MSRVTSTQPTSAVLRGVRVVTALVASFSLALLGVGTGGIGSAPASAAGSNTISGTVTSAATGLPVKDTYVYLTEWSLAYSDETMTDASGEYAFTDVPDGDYTMAYYDSSSSYAPTTSDEFALGSSHTHETADAELPGWPTGTASISGFVKDSITGLPIDTAILTLSAIDIFQDGFRETGADASGKYRFSDLPGGEFSLSVYAPGYVGFNFPSVGLESGDKLIKDIELVAANGGIRGTVTADGTGVGDLWVNATSTTDPNVSGSAGTDDDGNYEITDLGAGEYTVTFDGAFTPYATQSKTITAPANGFATADFALEAAGPRGTISGTVYNQNGDPVEGICVSAVTAPTGGTRSVTQADADGHYTLEDLDPGEYEVFFHDGDCPTGTGERVYAQTYYSATAENGSRSFAEGTQVPSNSDAVTGIDVHLVKGGHLSGLRQLQTPTGIRDIPVSRIFPPTVYQQVEGGWEVVPFESSFLGVGFSDYRILGLYPGTYRVCFEDPMTGPRAYADECWGNSATVEGGTDIVVTAGERTGGIDVAVGVPEPGFDPVAIPTASLNPEYEDVISSTDEAEQGESIDVRVGQGMAGEWVSVWGHSTPTQLGEWVQVGADGMVTVPVPGTLPDGDHTLVAQDADGHVIGWTDLKVLEADSGEAPAVSRLSGVDRYATAAEVAKKWSSASVVYVANGEGFPDALSAGPAAAHRDAPLLLTTSTSLSPAAKTQLERLHPSEIVIVGGTGVVSAAVEAQLEALSFEPTVRRLGGVDRYATSRLIAQDTFAEGTVETAYLADGSNFPDALTASPVAAHFDGPVVLVPGSSSSVDATTLALLDDLGVTTVKIAGGTGVVSAAIQSQLNTKYTPGKVTRNGGTDRYATAVEINADEFTSASTVYLATGTGFADALAGAALAGSQGAPLFVSQPTCIPQAVADAIESLGATSIVLLGGTGVLTAAVANGTVCH